MQKAGSQDNFVAYVAAAIVIALVGIFVLTWTHYQAKVRGETQVAYAKFGPFEVDTQKFSVRATLAVQTTDADADWVERNRKVLSVLFKKELADVDPNTVKTSHGLQSLQDSLKNSSNATLSASDIQAVLLTDFVLQAND